MPNNITEYNEIIDNNTERIEDQVLAVIFTKRTKFCLDSVPQIMFIHLKI